MTIRPLVLVDLDDTLFQTLRKCPADDHGRLVLAAHATNGAHSFMTPSQKAFVDWLLAHADVVPVTARGSEAFSRVAIPFANGAVLANGALVLARDGTPDEAWTDLMRAELVPLRDALEDVLARARARASVLGLDIRSWLVEENGLAAYAVVKDNSGDGTRLAELAIEIAADWRIHHNGNNLAFLPPPVSKRRAVEHLVAIARECDPDRPVLGFGDSLSDLDFLRVCDLWGTPARSQLDRSSGARTTEGGRTFAHPAQTALPPFSGTYEAQDVTFLLQPIAIAPTERLEKERAIQSGRRHYSEMIGEERAPGPEYRALYEAALTRGIDRLARETAALALALDERLNGPITLASLVRAGVPLGVLLRRALAALRRDVAHFGISIIRDRGIDENALRAILAERPAEGLVFVDGWTGKGAIATELEASLRAFPNLAPRLVVLADPCGRAWLAASGEDWLIPSGILGATVSGLVSRSILNDRVGEEDFHACVIWEHLRDSDVSRSFVDAVWARMQPHLEKGGVCASWNADDRAVHNARAAAVIEAVRIRFGIADRNRIKPGIAEATRAVLRRVPDRVLIRSRTDPDLAGILHLAEGAGVVIEEVRDAIHPYRALTVIRKLS